MFSEIKKNKIIIVVGHYGSGKTNVAVNLAIELKKRAKNVTLIDLDIVNPYFRAADAKNSLALKGIDSIIPEFANSNVDLPSLPAQINTVFDTLRDNPEYDGYYIFDVGGSDGAVALGMYNRQINECGYDMFCVINKYRPLTSTPEDTVEDMREIEQYSRLSVTGMINNSSVGVETDEKYITESIEYVEKTASLAGVPLLFTSYIPSSKIDFSGKGKFFKMENATKQLF